MKQAQGNLIKIKLKKEKAHVTVMTKIVTMPIVAAYSPLFIRSSQFSSFDTFLAKSFIWVRYSDEM